MSRWDALAGHNGLWVGGWGAGSAHLPVGRAAGMKSLTATAALEEAVPPPSRHGESNPDPWWLICCQGGPTNGS